MGSSLIDRSKLEAAYIGFRTLFNKAMAATPSAFRRIATVVETDNPSEEYKMLGSVPTAEKWVGDRKIAKLAADSYKIANEDWANGLEIDRNDLRDDKLGMLALSITQLAQAHVRRMDAEVIDVYVQGFVGTRSVGYDGQFLWDTDHTFRAGQGGSQSNKNTVALSDANLATAWAAFMGYKDDKGEPLEYSPKLLLVGPTLRDTARKLVGQPFKANGESNMDLNTLDLIVHPRITGSEWFLIDTAQAVLPCILQIQQMPQFVALDSMEDLNAFMRKTFLYGADSTFRADPGAWYAGYGSKP